MKNRIANLRLKLADSDIDALLVSQQENRFYLSGFNGWEGFLLITQQNAVLATDSRYIEHARRYDAGVEVFEIKGSIARWSPHLFDSLKIKKLGFEAEHITFNQHCRFSSSLEMMGAGLEMIPVTNLVEPLRVVKEKEEIEQIVRAAVISDAALEHIADTLCTGMSELEIAWNIEKFMRKQGSETLPFEVIVASGPNAALPHAQPSPRAVDWGEPIVIDIGARIGGHGSDLSRTLCLGSQDDMFRKIYGTVLKAQTAAIDGIREGMRGEEADSIARAVIVRAGYGDAFGHSLGHGIGLAPHEAPRLGPNSQEILTNGMVFSIEPGIYLSGWGGVRIEDTVVMENGRIKVISKARKI
ncbi:M24 family metallopeptidase [Chloroflexota bacterium]